MRHPRDPTNGMRTRPERFSIVVVDFSRQMPNMIGYLQQEMQIPAQVHQLREPGLNIEFLALLCCFDRTVK